MTITEIKGVDLSDYQRGLAIASLRSQGVSFVILKIGEGRTLADASFDAFYDAAIRSGLAVGAYFFSYAVTPEEGERDARRALSLIRGRALTLGIYIDVESSSQLTLRDSALTAVVKAFCDTIRDAGYRAGAYGSDLGLWAKVGPSFLGNDVLVWSASWGGKPHINCDVWQTSERGTFNGYNGNVDTDVCMSERFASLIVGEEPQPSPEPSPEPEPSHEPTFSIDGIPALHIGDTGAAVTALQGELIASGYPCGGKRKWCCGSETPDGIFGNVTAESVRSFQRAHNLPDTGVADKKTRAALLGCSPGTEPDQPGKEES